ncbi:hypothetical protein FA95DRAFT_873195 [Auriscalpium vulgare]|uniref:Uncharacterized protein n=1 Tax=Auriscalpium vulgare TaxID=40419 RepID=A0ACB8RZX8_9AGAM|nr:hypothetical protein FA95DRAFT_873195 [Auriscalpium vulgare]
MRYLLASLPATLVFLCQAILVFPLPSTPASPTLSTCRNDPFHALSTHRPTPPDEPVCCLKPLSPEPVDDDLFLSFEDWKSRRAAEAHAKDTVAPSATNVSAGEPVPEATSQADASGGSVAPDPTDGQVSLNEPVSPHFRVPITDRFNYASLDCSARVHTTHRSAKSASNILSSKRDRYMLSPCASERQHLIVELCEDIRIDTVQLANFEFFSGVFKDFTVSVAKTDATDANGWTVAGTYSAKNIRGVQSFHPPRSLTDFYRFLRIDFHSHYGNEYYCPISLLRVYGLTHLEQWKWDTWEEESRAKQDQAPPVVSFSMPAEVGQEPPIPAQTPEVASNDSTPIVNNGSTKTPTHVEQHSTPSSLEHDGRNRHSTNTARSLPENPSVPPSIPSTSSAVKPLSAGVEQGNSSDAQVQSSTTADSPVAATPGPSPGPSSMFSLDSASSSSSSASPISSSSVSAPSTPSGTPIISLSPAVVPAHIPSTGESIYRTIMNRLTALEANTTLYTRYVEEQTAGVREMLRRLGEDVGRLEGMSRAQAQLYQRSVSDMEKQRRRMEVEQRVLITQVNYLADEIMLEKRLGIAQLVLLLAVLVFLSVTRGSRSELPNHRTLRNVNVSGALSMKEWGRRNLSFSGDWVNRLRTRSRTPSIGEPTTVAAKRDKVIFPGSARGGVDETLQRTGEITQTRMATIATPTPGSAVKKHASSARPRTPSIRSSPRVHHSHYARAGPSTPTSVRPVIQRSASHSSAGVNGATSATLLVGPVPRSARRWARTAHLHEVRRTPSGATPGHLEAGDVFLNGGLLAEVGMRSPIRRRVSPLRVSTPSKDKASDMATASSDQWVDTDADASDSDWGAGHSKDSGEW